MHLQLNYKWQMKNPLDIQWKSTENPVKVKILHSLSRLQKGHQVTAMIRSLPIIWLLQSLAKPCQRHIQRAQSLKRFLHIDQKPQEIWSAPIVWLQNYDFINFCWVGVIVWAPGGPWSVQWGRHKPKQWPKLIFVKFGAPPHYLGL